MKRRKLYLYFHGIGDALLFNTILYYLGQQTGEKFLVGSLYPEIYQGNPYVTHLPCKSHDMTVLWRKALSGLNLITKYEYINYVADGPPKKHIIKLLCEIVGLNIVPKRPLIFLTDEEKRHRYLPTSSKPWIAIQSTGNKITTQNKNWSAEKFRQVVDQLKCEYSIVQFGSGDDPALDVDLNLCGKLSLRQLFVALGECKAFIGQVGFLMHSASAMEIPAVIVYGGFEAPWQSGYEKNINIDNPVECAPCWIWGPCPNANKCMVEISVDHVMQGFQQLIGQPQK